MGSALYLVCIVSGTPVFKVVQTQRALGDAFAEMSQKSPELHEEFSYNCETQRVISKNGETLIG